jgi:DNA-binding ferritin-like protein
MDKAGSADSDRTVWHTPTEYNPYRDGPPYLPMLPFEPVRLSSEQRIEVKSFVKKAGEMTPLLVTLGEPSPLVALLGVLQAASLLHQTHHWSTRGPVYYADHLLFERLYNESQEFIDQVAERAVGLGEPFISAINQARDVLSHVGQFGGSSKSPEKMVTSSLKAELACLAWIKSAIDRMTASGTLTPGVSNLLEGIADKHETFVYLLRQRASGGEGYSYDRG